MLAERDAHTGQLGNTFWCIVRRARKPRKIPEARPALAGLALANENLPAASDDHGDFADRFVIGPFGGRGNLVHQPPGSRLTVN